MLVQIDPRHPGKPNVEHEASGPRHSAAREKRFRRLEQLRQETLRFQNASNGLTHCPVVLDDRHGICR